MKVLLGGLLGMVLAVILGCDSSPPAAESPRATGFADTPVFRDRSETSGLSFQHNNGMSGKNYFCEIVGAGAAVFDYDNDGDLDLYLLQGQPLPAIGERVPRDTLYRNDLESVGDPVRFVDVSDQAGLSGVAGSYAMGIASGDYDNDGWVDLYITAFGPNRLLKNLGNGRFEDVTSAAGVAENRWSTSASFADLDGDGWLDLFVGNYVDFSLDSHKPCLSDSGLPDYCGPLSYRPETDRLFHNQGDGTFVDVTESMGLASSAGGALGVVTLDVDGDGLLDIYVANDQLPNHLWIRGPDRYREEGMFSGSAVNADGKPEASMGVEAADFDNDGDEDLFMAHLTRETNTLYDNEGGVFRDTTGPSGLGQPSWESTGFGAAALDYDNDGWLDLFVANGAVRTIEALARAGDPLPLHQRNQLFHNAGDGQFEETTQGGGDPFLVSEVTRGLAIGDLDNDGDIDVVLTNNHGPARYLDNQMGNRQKWLGLRLLTQVGSQRRDAHGALARAQLSDGRALVRRVRTDGSYASARDPRLLFGLGQAGVERVTVRWPGGREETFLELETGRYQEVVEGTGEPVGGGD